jgi:carbon monoxide dehydrogenase subunit G
MEITGTYAFAALPQRVWEVLMDPAQIASCIPGCAALEPVGENRYRAKMVISMAAITGNYDATIVVSDVVPLESYRLAVEGQGRPGFVKGAATITLRPDSNGTVVDVSALVQTGGPIARVGQRLIAGVAKSTQDRFFACLKGKL